METVLLMYGTPWGPQGHGVCAHRHFYWGCRGEVCVHDPVWWARGNRARRDLDFRLLGEIVKLANRSLGGCVR